MGVVIGTAVGTRVLEQLEERSFHRAVGAALIALAVWIGFAATG